MTWTPRTLGERLAEEQEFDRARKEQRRSRLPNTYLVSFVRGTERKTYRVSAWNKDEASVKGRRRLQEDTGERATGPGGWWEVGAERELW